MKKNDWLLFTAVGLYSFLFYQQSMGVNFLIFTLFLLAALSYLNKALLQNTNWLLAAAGSLVSAVCVAYYGNALSFTANFISLSLLSGLSCNPRTSVLFSLLSVWYSYFSAVVFMVLDYLERKQQRLRQGENPGVTRTWLIGLPLVVVFLFFFMYRAANPLFYNFTRQLSFEFISWGWLTFTASGFILLYGFFYHRPIAELTIIDALASNKLYPTEEKNLNIFGKAWNLKEEIFTGVILLGLLNLLLLVVNALDLNYLYFGLALPAGMNYSESVHQSIGMLIASILVAIAIILFYFRGNLNFYHQNKNLKLLAYTWIFQNAFMLISTAYRNYLYIQEYSLTYKRIGVFIYLLLVLAGLVSTNVKIARIKSNWYLFRQNAWVAYLVLVMSGMISWDLLITRFNINRAQTQAKSLDRQYLLSLSAVNLPELLQLQNQDDKINLALNQPVTPALQITAADNYSIDSTFQYKAQLHRKLINYVAESGQNGWQSWNQMQQQTLNKIHVLEQTRNIPHLILPAQQFENLPFAANFPHLVDLNLSRNKLKSLGFLQPLKQLEQLDISDNKLTSISSLPKLPRLKSLNLSNNDFSNAQAIQRVPTLEQLNLAETNVTDLATLSALPHLAYLNLSGTNIASFAPLKQYPKLQFLILKNSLNSSDQTLPVLPTVTWLDLSANNLNNSKSPIFESLRKFQQLKHVDLANNNLESLSLAPEIKAAHIKSPDSVNNIPADKTSPDMLLLPFPDLESLNLANNKLKSTAEIKAYPKLRQLYLNGNAIEDLAPLAVLSALEVLHLQENQLSNTDQLIALTSLKELNLAANKIKLNPVVFSSLTKLKKLDISNNKLTDVAALSNCTSLRYLNLSHNKITSLSALRQLTHLEYLQVNNNPIQDYTALYNLKQLKELWVSSQIPDEVYQSLSRALPKTLIIRADVESASKIESAN